MKTGLVFNIQRFSTDDGDGIRTCVFLKGCPLHCVWCHNAESISFFRELASYSQNCIGCGACTKTCPTQALFLKNQKATIDRARCSVCGSCAEVCYSEALVMIGKKMTVDEVMETVRKDRIFYETNGGLTITGGEPMAQPQFTLALAKAAKAEGLSVALETSGFCKPDDFMALIPYCDIFLFDCKASTQRHGELVGTEDALILQNLAQLAQNGAKIRLRCPIIKGANLDNAFVEKIISLAKTHPEIEAVQLMPYHKTGIQKAETLGKTAQTEFATPDEQTLASLAKKIVQESGKPTFY